MFAASLHRPHPDPEGFRRLHAAFIKHNPTYKLWHTRSATRIDATESLVVFFHGGAGEASSERATSNFALGDVALLRPGETLCADSPFDAVLFALPVAFPDELPTFLRPDHDPIFQDQPGGCAVDAAAYRRPLLTWLPEHGPYVLHGLNTHRVRMDDSLSHYHPMQEGHDELYLVQAARPGASVLHSDRVARILAPETVTREEARTLIHRLPVATGDLVYFPRGHMHRAVAGVLAHVIAVPGFRPGSEIALDDKLLQINQRLGLRGHEALPVHAPKSTTTL